MGQTPTARQFQEAEALGAAASDDLVTSTSVRRMLCGISTMTLHR